jgi:hypothetical protein
MIVKLANLRTFNHSIVSRDVQAAGGQPDEKVTIATDSLLEPPNSTKDSRCRKSERDPSTVESFGGQILQPERRISRWSLQISWKSGISQELVLHW